MVRLGNYGHGRFEFCDSRFEFTIRGKGGTQISNPESPIHLGIHIAVLPLITFTNCVATTYHFKKGIHQKLDDLGQTLLPTTEYYMIESILFDHEGLNGTQNGSKIDWETEHVLIFWQKHIDTNDDGTWDDHKYKMVKI